MPPRGGDRGAAPGEAAHRLPGTGWHSQRPDCQVAFHAGGDGPAVSRLECRSRITAGYKPPLTGPDAADFARRFRYADLRFWFGRSAVTSRSGRFGAMLNVGALSVPRRGNDPPDHFLTLPDLECACSFNDDPVPADQPPDPPPAAVRLQTATGQRETVIHLFCVDIPPPRITGTLFA